MKIYALTLTLLSSALVIQPLFAGSGGFYDRESEGWHWYQQDQVEIDLLEENDPPPPVPIKPVEDDRPDPKTTPAAPAETVKPLSYKWIQQNLVKFQERAVDAPTDVNVAAYLYLQRMAMDKSQRFGDAAKKVVMKNAMLDENTRRPESSYASTVMDQQAKASQEGLLKQLSKDTEIWYFFKGKGCVTCGRQAEVVKAMQRLYGFNIRNISVDGVPLPNVQDYVVDRGQSSTLSVNSFPAIVIARPPNKILRISFGAQPVSELSKRIFTLGYDAGWITTEEFESTRPINNIILSPTDVVSDVDYADDAAAFIKLFEGR